MQLTARAVAKQIYYPSLALIGAALIYFFPPKFDFSTPTLITVGLVALFLAFVSRPAKAASVQLVPLTAIFAASAVLFGWWTLVLAPIAWAAIHVRGYGHAEWWRILKAWAGHVGWSVIAVYAMVAIWKFGSHFAVTQSHIFGTLITMATVIAVGLTWQTINNVCTQISYAIVGQAFPAKRFITVGLIAAVYAYLLVALYQFGGIIAAALFYVIIGQDRMVQGVLGITKQLQLLHNARSQARTLVGDLMRFADADQGRFAEEVQALSQRIAGQVGLSRDEVAKIGLAAELHEIGKARLPARVRVNGNGNGNGHADAIQQSSGGGNGGADLSLQEIAQLRTYPRAGAIMVREADALLPSEIAYWIECHDEHFDGSGFPRGLKGNEIPLPSRIIAVSREFVRLTIGANGDYESQKDAALAEIREKGGTLYDPELVSILDQLVNEAPQRRSPLYAQ